MTILQVKNQKNLFPLISLAQKARSALPERAFSLLLLTYIIANQIHISFHSFTHDHLFLMPDIDCP